MILDSSGLLAAIDVEQEDHNAAVEALAKAPGPAVMSPFVLAELDYMIRTLYGRDEELALLGEVERGAYRLESFSASNVAEARSVVKRYAGFGDVGLADASNVVLARRHGTRDILTLDERHFRTLRGPQDRPFRLLPVDL